MKLKLDEQGHAVLNDGKPVYVHDDGKEIAFDAAASVATIERITNESKGYKTRAQDAETKVKAFEGIDDADAARKALETIKNIDQGQLIAAGKVEELKAGITKAAEEKIAAATKASNDALAAEKERADKLDAALSAEMIGGRFSRSKFISDKAAIPADMMQARFGQAFRIEEGKVVAYDQSGNKIYSRAKPGDVADFDEAMEILVDSYAYKDHILKGTGGGGSGKDAGRGMGAGGDKTMSRAEFEKLPHADRAAKMKDGLKIVD